MPGTNDAFVRFSDVQKSYDGETLVVKNLNMDIDVTTFLRIPFTNIGFPNIDRELLRRYSISEQLDFYVQRDVDKTLAPLLGWHD